MIESVLKSILATLYSQIGACFVVSILFMVVWKNAREQSWKLIIKEWIKDFRTDCRFREVFFFAFVVIIILFRTILCRSIWSSNPLKNVIGIWGLKDEKGQLYTDGMLNCVLFIPFSFLFMNNYKNASLHKTILCSFLFSLGIETTQLLLKCGEFQLSDIFYNTFGGLVGSILFVIFNRIRRAHNSEGN